MVEAGIKHELGIEVAGRDRLIDYERILAGYRVNLHPIHEFVRSRSVDQLATVHRVQDLREKRGAIGRELATSRIIHNDLTRLTRWRRRSWCWSGRGSWCWC